MEYIGQKEILSIMQASSFSLLTYVSAQWPLSTNWRCWLWTLFYMFPSLCFYLFVCLGRNCSAWKTWKNPPIHFLTAYSPLGRNRSLQECVLHLLCKTSLSICKPDPIIARKMILLGSLRLPTSWQKATFLRGQFMLVSSVPCFWNHCLADIFLSFLGNGIFTLVN